MRVCFVSTHNDAQIFILTDRDERIQIWAWDSEMTIWIDIARPAATDTVRLCRPWTASGLGFSYGDARQLLNLTGYRATMYLTTRIVCLNVAAWAAKSCEQSFLTRELFLFPAFYCTPYMHTNRWYCLCEMNMTLKCDNAKNYDPYFCRSSLQS